MHNTIRPTFSEWDAALCSDPTSPRTQLSKRNTVDIFEKHISNVQHNDPFGLSFPAPGNRKVQMYIRALIINIIPIISCCS
jgi:hypothetical protein